jgi:serine/threonine protein kinase/Tfp pilus assembly protein PilF
MTTATRCVRCGRPDPAGDCPACETGLDLGNLFRRTEEANDDFPAFTHPGNHFGDFIRVERLGDGGMGEVWKAWDRKLRRWVALKFPKCESGSDLERLKAEATSAGIVSHPNVATVYGVGQANGHHFIAMQYIDGVTLADYPRDDRRKLIAFVRYAAMGVACAHSHGIIHRDLKPENIMVEREQERIYVTDFGIARPAASGRATSVIGTPPYMSPEQARGDSVDGRSDVYSLTATLYDLLADRPPFIGVSPADTLQHVLFDDPQPLRHLDGDLNAILMKGLDKSPSERYPTVLEFAEDLQRYLRDEPVRARRANPLTWMRKMIARHRAVAAAATIGLAATLFVTGLLVSARSAERSRRETQLREFERLDRERRAQGRLLEAEVGKRSDLRELLVLWSKVVLAKQGWYQPRMNPQATRRDIEAAVSGLNAYVLRNPGQFQGYYVRARGRLYVDNLEGARSDLEKAIEIEPAFGPGWALLGRVKGEQFFRSLIGDSGETLPRLREATPLLQQANAAFQRSREHRAATTGWGLETMEDEKVAEVLARAMALAYVDRNPEEARQLLENAHREAPSEEYCNLLGVWSGDEDRNIAWQTEALSIRPHYGMAYFDRAIARSRRGDAAGALADYTKSLDANPRFLPARFNRAHLLLSSFNEPRRALEDFAAMLRINSQLAPVYSGRARARVALGDDAGALEELAAALSLAPRDALLHRSRAAVRIRLREFLGAVGDAAEAVKLNPRDVESHVLLAAAKLGVGDLRGALEDAGVALLLDPHSASGYGVRARIRNESGDPAGAAQDATEALRIDVRSAAPHVERAIAHLKLGRAGLAAADATEALKIDPRAPRAHAVRAEALARMGKLNESLADFAKALALNPRDAEAYADRAAVHIRRGEADKAAADAAGALAIDPRCVPALLVRAKARIALGDVDGAVEDATRALREDPRQSKAYALRGLARERKGDFRGAVEDATLASMLDPLNVGALANRSTAKMRLGDLDGAIQDLTSALALRPQSVELRFKRGCLLLLASKNQEARQDLARVVQSALPK